MSAATIPSAQELSPGVPRFQVPVLEHPSWEQAAAAESEGGVAAEVRAFFDAQLETGDLVLDFDPGFGFVALSATTAPAGMPTVMIAGLSEERLVQLQDAAAEAGGWVDGFDAADPELHALIDARLESESRIFVHLAAEQVAMVTAALAPFMESGRVLAFCISDAAGSEAWTAASATLQQVGFTACALLATEEGMLLVPVQGAPTAAVLALPSELVAAEAAADDTASDDTVTAEPPPTDIFPTPSPAAIATPVLTSPTSPLLTKGFAFQSSHSRTGYGVAGAHLLKALQARGVPVAYFPIGPVDPSLAANPALRTALDAQARFPNDMPSVRLSQQFDLAQHIGRGPRVGFTIFELDTFTAGELHHLRNQDALLVCSDWARDIVRQNGVTDIPVHVVPLGVDREVFHAQVPPARQFSETTFLQVGKLEPRKGQRELLAAFEAAFTPKDAVRLVLVCGNPFVSKAQMDELLTPFRRSPMASRITLLTQELASQQEVASWMAAADCGVFAARAEGWNLEALEMLAMGREVIATNYSAHRQFLTAEVARLVSIDGLELAYPGRSTGQWAAWGAAQHEQLVTHLRAVHAQRQQHGRQVNAAGLDAAMRFSWDAAAGHLLQALETLG